jgi:hypothetical protein
MFTVVLCGLWQERQGEAPVYQQIPAGKKSQNNTDISVNQRRLQVILLLMQQVSIGDIKLCSKDCAHV